MKEGWEELSCVTEHVIYSWERRRLETAFVEGKKGENERKILSPDYKKK